MTDEVIKAVYDFWFVENGPKQWFTKDAAFDTAIRDRFEALVEKAATGGLSHWRATARGALTEIIVLDQFPRNLYRNAALGRPSTEEELEFLKQEGSSF